MKTIENEQLVETTGGHRFAPGYYPYAPAPYPYARPFVAPRAAYYPYAYGGWWPRPAFAPRPWW